VAARFLCRGSSIKENPIRRGKPFVSQNPDARCATTDQDLRVPPSNHFEKLRGNLEGFHSIRVNKQWRLIFQWDGGRGEATDVYLDDHSYL
jgi:plasmid maintenance system killer protein